MHASEWDSCQIRAFSRLMQGPYLADCSPSIESESNENVSSPESIEGIFSDLEIT